MAACVPAMVRDDLHHCVAETSAHSVSTPRRTGRLTVVHRLRRQLACGLLGIATLVVAAVANATSVAEVSVDEMLVQADLVFEGRVISRQARRGNPREPIRTFVTFAINDIIKGRWPAATIELAFLGGVVDGDGLRVAGMVIPEPGERGIYFVESATRGLVQPFYGWTQGEFRVVEGPAGAQRVVTRGGKPVHTIESNQPARRGALSTGVARGIATGEPATIGEAMAPADFKARLRERLRTLDR